MSTINEFRVPKDIVWGRGAFMHLKDIPGKSALIVTDQSMTHLGVTARAEAYLRKGGLATRIFDEVQPEPGIDAIIKMVETYRDTNPDLILGVGGGSAIDASKAFRIFFEHPQLSFEDIRYLKSPPKVSIPPFTKTRHVTASSTSGTGSDVSCVCVLTDPKISMKCPVRSPELIPDMAIVDPDIADTMPPELLADSGLDALTHATESYVNIRAGDFTRGLSLKAIALIMANLPSAFKGQDAAAKEHMHYAATIAGLAFSNSGNGLCHTIADKVGAAFKLSHGRANAIALPYVIKYNSRLVGDQYMDVARAAEYRGEDLDGAVAHLIQKIAEIKRLLRVPANYREAGISASAYNAKLETFAANAATFPATASNPRKPSLAELKTLFTACFEGDYGLL